VSVSSGTSSPGLSWTNGRRTVVVVLLLFILLSAVHLFVCDLKTEQDQEAEENSMMYADLKAARETIADLKQSKGSASVYTCLCDILQIL